MKYITMIVCCLCLSILTLESRGDFVLWNSEQMEIDTLHTKGTLYDQSKVSITTGGRVVVLYAYDDSEVEVYDGGNGGNRDVQTFYGYGNSRMVVYDGSVADVISYGSISIEGGSIKHVDAYGGIDVSGGMLTWDSYVLNSFANISGGSVYGLNAWDNSTVNVSGGVITSLTIKNSIANISGGSIEHLSSSQFSDTTFIGSDFRLGDGLSLDGDQVVGAGRLSGEWYDGTRWITSLAVHSTATVTLTPEPATLLLLAFGSVLMLRRKL